MDEKNKSRAGSATSVNLDPALLREFRVKCAELGFKKNQGLDAAVRAWVGSPVQQENPAAVQHLSDRHAEEVKLLRFILEQGSKQEADWIRGNLKMFAEAIRSRVPERAARRKSGT